MKTVDLRRERWAAHVLLASTVAACAWLLGATVRLEHANERRAEQLARFAQLDSVDVRGCEVLLGPMPEFDGLFARRLCRVGAGGNSMLAFADESTGGSP